MMFSKSKINDPAPKEDAAKPAPVMAENLPRHWQLRQSQSRPLRFCLLIYMSSATSKTTGDIQVEGTVEADSRAFTDDR